MTTVATHLVNSLVAAGVRRVYGVVGDSLNSIVDAVHLFLECSHFCQLVGTEKQMPRLLQIAMQASISKGGVSVLVLPGDVAASEMTSKDLEHPVFHPRPAIQPGTEELQKLAHLLNESDRITIFGGAGCADAHDEILDLAKQLQAPIAYSFRGKEFLEFDNPYAAGMTGLLGTESGHFALEKADLVFLLGTDFPYTAWYPKKAKILQLDIRA